MNCLENAIGDQARNLTYQDFPYHFVWHKDMKTWIKRLKGFSLGRMYFVPPTLGERFYLRTLLTVSRGPRSFTDLCTFQDTCRACGLLEDDGEWNLCLREATQIQTGASLCHLFSSMLLFCQVNAPENLWLEFGKAICDDLFISIPNPTVHRILDYGLFLINRLLREFRYSLEQFLKMPLSFENWIHVNGNFLISEQLMYDFDSELQSFQQHMENVQSVLEQVQLKRRIVHTMSYYHYLTYMRINA